MERRHCKSQPPFRSLTSSTKGGAGNRGRHWAGESSGRTNSIPGRHGQLDLQAFAENQFSAGLTLIGREQARYTAKRFRSLDISAIYSSTLGRARETAEIISKEFPSITVRRSKLLWELPNLSPVKDEAWRIVFAKGKQRGERAFVKYVRPTRQRRRIEVLVSHGNLIRYFACRVLSIAPESWSTLGSSHCGITELRIAPENHVRLIGHNETGHLPVRLQLWLRSTRVQPPLSLVLFTCLVAGLSEIAKPQKVTQWKVSGLSGTESHFHLVPIVSLN